MKANRRFSHVENYHFFQICAPNIAKADVAVADVVVTAAVVGVTFADVVDIAAADDDLLMLQPMLLM